MTEDYTVYKHISPSGKQYIGITSIDVESRWNNGNGYRNNSYFTNAIKKYGWNNFQHIVLYKNLSKDEACEIEKRLIKELDLTNPSKGYNLTFGGEHGKISDQTKETISNSLKGNKRRLGIQHTQATIQHLKDVRTGKNPHEWSEESRKKLSDSKRGTIVSKETKQKLSEMRIGNGNSFYGRHHTPYTKDLLRKINTGKRHTESGDFIKEWASIKSASEALNIKHISDICRGGRKLAGGFKRAYKERCYE